MRTIEVLTLFCFVWQANCCVFAANEIAAAIEPNLSTVKSAGSSSERALSESTDPTNLTNLTNPTDAIASIDPIDSIDPREATNRVEDLTRQILLKEIELERFNLHYKMEVAKQGRWKGWRYGFWQGGVNSGMSLTGAIIGTAERGSHIHSPDKLHVAMQENACFIPMIGSFVGVGAALFEFMVNEWHDLEAREKGFSPKAARDHVDSLKSEINSLLHERAALVKIEAGAPLLAQHAKVDAAEGQVLGDIRDQGLMEYQRFHISARKVLAFQQSQYFFDFSKYMINALGYEFAFLSLHKHDRKWNMKAGVMFDIAGPIYMGGPIVSRLFAKGVGELHKHYVRGTIKDAESSQVATLERDEQTLTNLCKDVSLAPDTVAGPVDRAAIYGAQSKVFQDELLSGANERNKAKLSATQNIGAGMYVGSSKLASGILFTIPGFYRQYNNKTFLAARVTNNDLFAASIVSIPASAFSMLDTLRINVRGEIERRQLTKAGINPIQLTNSRLAQLDAMEKSLRVLR